MEPSHSSFYSRQIATFGLDMMKSLSNVHILLHGLSGVGIEACKNLTLSGPSSISIHDDSPITTEDVSSCYCYKSEDIGKKRSLVCFESLHSLNPYVKFEVLEGEITNDFLDTRSLVLVTDTTGLDMVQMSKYCRSKEIALVACDVFGLAGMIFLDFGDGFTSVDPLGREEKEIPLALITNTSPGIVHVAENKPHFLRNNEYVVFKDVHGTEELNSMEPQRITVIDRYTFSICDTSSYGKFVSGLVKKVTLPKSFTFQRWEETLLSPGFAYPMDASKGEKIPHMHLAFQAIRHYFSVHQGLPETLNQAQADECLSYARLINNLSKATGHPIVDEIDPTVIRNCAMFSRIQLPPIVSFWGALAAQECLKITHKYTPLQGLTYLDFFELLTENPQISESSQEIILGKEAFAKLSSLKVFLVGAGALGCEYLKHFALMGLGEVVLTDDDSIETSNLNRQFLFRGKDIGHNKSLTAANAIREMRNHIEIRALDLRVGPDNENYFSDEFFEGLDLIVNAVDNVSARTYIDEKCLFHNLALFESGTEGLNASSQIILPKLTCSYSDNTIQTKEEIPACTIKTFPYLIEHCIHWSREKFEEIFNVWPREYNQFASNYSDFMEKYHKSDESSQSETKLFLSVLTSLIKSPSPSSCISFARFLHRYLFATKIQELTSAFPEDALTEEGQRFWLPPKRFPYPLEEPSNEFVLSVAKLTSKMLGISDLTPCEAILAADSLQYDVIEEITEAPGPSQFQVLSFEKDDDLHVDFIHSASNERAKNYRLSLVDREKAKKISGNIIPAVATTTSVITSLTAIEIYKVVAGKALDLHRCAMVDLSEPFIRFSIPRESINYVTDEKCAVVPDGITSWDKIEGKGLKSLRNIRDFVQEEYKVQLEFMACGKDLIYDVLIYDDSALDIEIETLRKYKQQKYIELLFGCKQGKIKAKIPKMKVFL